MLIDPVLYQVQVQAVGSRDGRAVSSDGVLDVQLATPRALGGAGRRGTNPEQRFAAGYVASFLSSAGTRIQELFIINMLGHIFTSKTEPYRTGGP